MKYSDVKDDIKAGDIIAYSRSGVIPWLIKTVTGSKYSHIGVVWVIGKHKMVLEATLFNGVDIRELNTENFLWIPTGLGWDENKENEACSKLEIPYSIIDAIRAGLGLRPSRSGQICTFLVDDVLGLSRELDRPCDVVKYFLDRGHPIQEVEV